jgi:hypothetical protein
MFVCCYFVAQSIRFFASQILLFQAASLRSQYMTSDHRVAGSSPAGRKLLWLWILQLISVRTYNATDPDACTLLARLFGPKSPARSTTLPGDDLWLSTLAARLIFSRRTANGEANAR